MALSTGKMARYAAIGWEFTMPTIVGAIIGHYLDQYFRTDPWLTLAMFLLGLFAGFYRLIQELSAIQRDNKDP
ncbi:MAG: AtpZ/AtpI family protein [Candidatus Binataceae bacterium]